MVFINVIVSTIVGIATFISMINTTSEKLKARYFFTFWYFSFLEQWKFHAQLSKARKKFYNPEALLVHLSNLFADCNVDTIRISNSSQ